MSAQRWYACLHPQKYSEPRLSILRLQQEEVERILKWDIKADDMEKITRQKVGALTAYRERREWFGENSYNRKALENLWEISVEIARLERAACPTPSHDPAHWLSWKRSEFPCVY